METKADPRTPPVGILTTMKRPAWAKAREELLKRMYYFNYNSTTDILNIINSTIMLIKYNYDITINSMNHKSLFF